MRTVDGKHQIVLDVAAMALNRHGSMVEHKAEQITMTLPEDVVRRSPVLPITVDQQIDLSKDDKFLHVGVWDTVNGRFLKFPSRVSAKRRLAKTDRCFLIGE
jgi:hypothetical protein